MNEIHQFLILFTKIFMGFFAIMNPIANAPVFLGLTQKFDKKGKVSIATKASVIAFLIVFVFCILGGAIFDLFGISIDAFKVAGGLLVAIIGMNMLHGESSKVQKPTAVSSESEDLKSSALDISISPLALPIMAGPGTIATAISYTAHKHIEHIVTVVIALLAVILLNFITFVLSERIVKFLGAAGIKVVTRLMGLILAVIGVQMLFNGVFALIKINLNIG